MAETEATGLLQTDQIFDVPVSQLLLDPLNPRLPFVGIGSVTQDRIIDYMLREGNIAELMGAIGEIGFQRSEPLLVTSVKEGDPDWDLERSRDTPLYYVVEGNRRLTAVLLLLNPGRAKHRRITITAVSTEATHRPTEVPVLVFDKREDLLDYLGYRHITGTKPWGALEKAIYLDQLSQARGATDFQALAKTIGSRSDYVAKLLTGLKVYRTIEERDFFDLPGVERETVSFSLITTALGYAKLNEFIGLTSARDHEAKGLKLDELRKLTEWMFRPFEGKTRLGDSRNLGDLGEVVAETAALKAFVNGRPLAEAVLLTGQPTQVFREAVEDAYSRLKDAQAGANKARDLAETDAERLRDVSRLARDLARVVEGRLFEDED
ncbi:MAG: hypothetical protein AAF791_01950 [Bacteroidota bacterium]